MDDFVNHVNRMWDASDPVVLASYVLWRLNHIDPFINGNGRTARAASYFGLCLRAGAWLPGNTTLPDFIAENRERYVAALQEADKSVPTRILKLSMPVATDERGSSPLREACLPLRPYSVTNRRLPSFRISGFLHEHGTSSRP